MMTMECLLCPSHLEQIYDLQALVEHLRSAHDLQVNADELAPAERLETLDQAVHTLKVVP
jgi:hypothetical protein